MNRETFPRIYRHGGYLSWAQCIPDTDSVLQEANTAWFEPVVPRKD